MKRVWRIMGVLFFLHAITMYELIELFPASAAGERNVIVKKIEGIVLHQKAGEGPWLPVQPRMILNERDKIKTDKNSSAELLFEGQSNSTVTLRQETTLDLSTVGQESTGDNTELDLYVGSVLIKAEKLKGESEFKVKSPNSVVGIRGTEFEVTVE